MITHEQLEEALSDDNKEPFRIKGFDHDVKVISLLRERIPYEECKSIISGAEHDILYLCDVDIILLYLIEEDLEVLAECNCYIDYEGDCIAIFV